MAETRAVAPPDSIAYEDYLERDDERSEWVAGRVVAMAAVSDEHAAICGFLTSVLTPFVEQHDLGVIRADPFKMKTGADLPGRSPDLLFVAKANLSRITRKHLAGPADAAVEVISPDSRARDRGEKYYEYEAGGVREYWLIDPDRRQAEFHGLGEDGIYRVLPIGPDGVFRSLVIDGLWLEVAWLWRRPRVLEVLKLWRLV